MAGDNRNLNKDEAEILNPSTPASSSSATPSVYLKPSTQEFLAPERSQLVEKVPVEALEAAVPSSVEENVSPSLAKPEADSWSSSGIVRFSNRCSNCQRKVGLTGFRCRCGELFCGRHRYSDAHDCTFDYKTVGREQISKANPLVRAAKIIKI